MERQDSKGVPGTTCRFFAVAQVLSTSRAHSTDGVAEILTGYSLKHMPRGVCDEAYPSGGRVPKLEVISILWPVRELFTSAQGSTSSTNTKKIAQTPRRYQKYLIERYFWLGPLLSCALASSLLPVPQFPSFKKTGRLILTPQDSYQTERVFVLHTQP